MPPTGGITKSINTLADEVWLFGCQFFSVEACNDAEEGEVALDVFAPMVLPQAEAKDVVKLGLRLG